MFSTPKACKNNWARAEVQGADSDHNHDGDRDRDGDGDGDRDHDHDGNHDRDRDGDGNGDGDGDHDSDGESKTIPSDPIRMCCVVRCVAMQSDAARSGEVKLQFVKH
jgi:hypothetical protein